MEKIFGKRQVLQRLQLSPEAQTTRLLQRLLTCCTTHVRMHVDVAPAIGLAHLHGVLATREQQRERIDV